MAGNKLKLGTSRVWQAFNNVWKFQQSSVRVVEMSFGPMNQK